MPLPLSQTYLDAILILGFLLFILALVLSTKREVFEPYEGSSDTFKHYYRIAKELLNTATTMDDLDKVIKVLDKLSILMSTQGDGRLIEELQQQLRVSMAAISKSTKQQFN